MQLALGSSGTKFRTAQFGDFGMDWSSFVLGFFTASVVAFYLCCWWYEVKRKDFWRDSNRMLKLMNKEKIKLWGIEKDKRGLTNEEYDELNILKDRQPAMWDKLEAARQSGAWKGYDEGVEHGKRSASEELEEEQQ